MAGIKGARRGNVIRRNRDLLVARRHLQEVRTIDTSIPNRGIFDVNELLIDVEHIVGQFNPVFLQNISGFGG